MEVWVCSVLLVNLAPTGRHSLLAWEIFNEVTEMSSLCCYILLCLCVEMCPRVIGYGQVLKFRCEFGCTVSRNAGCFDCLREDTKMSSFDAVAVVVILRNGHPVWLRCLWIRR